MKFARPFAVVSAVALAAGVSLVAPAVASAKPADRLTLAGSAASSLERAHLVGAVAPSSRVSFDVVMKLRDAGAATALVTRVSTPGSASYRHFLTAARWEARFSPSASEIARTTTWLRQAGFHVGRASEDRLTVPASGTAAQVEKAFGTTLGDYRQDGRVVRLASRNFSIPTSLGAIVTGLMGVNQHPMVAADQTGTAATTPASEPVPPPAAFVRSPICSASYGKRKLTEHPAYGDGYPTSVPEAVCGYKPGQLRSAYSIGTSDTGKGVTIAVIDAYASSTQPADANRYTALNDPSHPLNASNFSQVVDRPFIDKTVCGASGWQPEEAIDIEAEHAMAPGAHILYVGASDCIDGLFTALENVVDNHLADIVSNSYDDTAGDLLDDAAEKAAYDDEFLLAASTGISVMFSSGDDGDDFDLTGLSAPEYPASSPYVTAVGGTTLEINSKGERTAEYGWSTGRSILCSANAKGIVPGCTAKTVGTWLTTSLDGESGGGTSYSYAQPAYQKGVVPTVLSERNANIFGPVPFRVLPDISMDADSATGFLIGLTEVFPHGVVKYGETRYGGTSLASPLLAGAAADAEQLAGTELGLLNPAIYAIDRAKPGAIEDITPPGKKAQLRVDRLFQLEGAGAGNLVSFRKIAWEGKISYCDETNHCSYQDNTLRTTKGYDSMTGVGSINPGFLRDLADT